MKVRLKSGKAARRRRGSGVGAGSGGEFPLALGMDAPLRVVAVHDQHVVAERVVQVACEQRGEVFIPSCGSD